MADKMRSKISDIKIPILKPNNYVEWKIKITSLLKAKELYPLIESAPTDVETLEEKYLQVNEEAKSIIYSSLDGRTTQAAGICETAHELWLKVTGAFEGLKDDLTGLAMARFMEIAKQKDEKLNDFLGRYEIALNNLASTEMVVDLALAIYVLCRTLPQNIKEGIRVWRTVNSDGTIDQIISYIRANYRDEDVHQDANCTAFFGVANSRKKWRPRKTNAYPRNKGDSTGGDMGATNKQACSYCKKTGHVWRTCFKLKRDNEAKGANNRKESAHMALERSYQAYQQYLPNKSERRWIIDSGATSHMTHERDLLMNYTSFSDPKEVMVGDGEHIEAEGKGWLFIRGDIKPRVVKDVLYVPKMPVNLFSVKAALKQGYSISFSKNQVKVEHDGQPVPAFFDGCLFTIDLGILNKNTSSTQEAYPACSLETWHKRLNHCGLDLIKRMQKEKMVTGLDIGESPYQCEDCMLGKSSRKPHPMRSRIKATKDLAILHFDTVDTSVESLGGKRYFILGTEEFSGYKLIDFVAKKSEITNCVKLMINSVMLNTSRPVACIYSDNGTEFVNIELREWLSERGIIHELSSAYNPEQNGRAEASNKAVINGARTFLVGSKLPKTLWAEACSASTYVLNRLPSVTSPTITRYELYFGIKPNVGNLHEFGEVAIRLTPKQLRENKLDPVAKRYRFVGYTNRYNTFRLYDETSKKIIIDCNVRFTNKQPELAQESNEGEDEYASIRWEECAEKTTRPSEASTAIDDSFQNFGSAAEQSTNDTFILEPEVRLSTSSNINDAIHDEIRSRNQNQTGEC